MIEYDVLECRSIPDLTGQMLSAIAKGWEPIGGIAVTHYDGDPRWFYQAMIRRQTPDHPPRQVP